MDLSAHTSLAGLAEVVAAVQAAASATGGQVYLAGALARDLWLEFGHGIEMGRKTEDADFAIECDSWRTFDGVAQALEDQHFKRDERKQHRFRHRNGIEIDVIPFGGIEDSDRTIAWPLDGNPAMTLVGFSEVARSTVGFVLPGDTVVQVVSLPALAVLKLLAWEDRRREWAAGNKDAEDLVVIATHYLDVREPRLPLDDEARLLERHGFEDRLASAELLGRDMSEFGSTAVLGAVGPILAREGDPEGPLDLARIVNRYEPLAGAQAVRALHAGFLLANERP